MEIIHPGVTPARKRCRVKNISTADMINSMKSAPTRMVLNSAASLVPTRKIRLNQVSHTVA